MSIKKVIIALAIVVVGVLSFLVIRFEQFASIPQCFFREPFTAEVRARIKSENESVQLQELQVSNIKETGKGFVVATSGVMFTIPIENPEQFPGGNSFHWGQQPQRKALLLMGPHDFSTVFEGLLLGNFQSCLLSSDGRALGARILEYFHSLSDQQLFNDVVENKFERIPYGAADMFSAVRASVLNPKGTNSVTIRGKNRNGVEIGMTTINGTRGGEIYVFKDGTEILDIAIIKLTADELDTLVQSIRYR